MKSIIEYEYGIKVDDIRKHENTFYVRNNKNTYILEETNYNEEMLNFINQSGLFYKIVINKEGKYITEIRGIKYILYKIEKITINDNLYIKEKIQKDWGILWSNKLDKIRKEIINDSLNEYLDYYIGLAENAIMIWNIINKNSLKYKMCRIRMYNRILKNPNNAIIDIKERDAAEYIKYSFFYEKENIKELTKNYYRDGYDMELIYCRLLFPTYYFDLIEDYLIKEKSDNKSINKIITKQKQFEDFLNYYNDKYIKKLQH